MDKIRLVLLLISIAITIGPVAAVLITYKNDLQDAVIPPEIYEVRDDLKNETPSIASIYPSRFNSSSRTVSITISIKNPYMFKLTIDSISANVVCVSHGFALGKVTSSGEQSILPHSIAPITAVVALSGQAMNHASLLHAGETKINARLTDVFVDVQGINVKLDDMTITIPIA